MNNPQQYIISNSSQRYEANRALETFLPEIHWRPDGEDAILDIGCGSGDVTWDILKPKLPQNFRELLAVDLSEEMIKYARSKYIHDRVEFAVMNIETPNLSDNYKNRFDHVFSFYCLHWVQNQRQAFQNIYDMLKPGGEVLAIWIGQSRYYSTLEEMSKMKEWKTIMYDVHKYISPYHNKSKHETFLTNLVTDIGFDVHTCCQENKKTYFSSFSDFRNFLKSINTFKHRMSDETEEQYMRHFVKQFPENELINKEDNQNSPFAIPDGLITLFGRKR